MLPTLGVTLLLAQGFWSRSLFRYRAGLSLKEIAIAKGERSVLRFRTMRECSIASTCRAIACISISVVIAIFFACSSGDPPASVLTQGCILNTDCASPLVCAFRKCHQACNTSRDCPVSQRCVASDRPLHVCQLAEERDCVYNSDCPGGQSCGIDQQCRDQCAGDRDCVRDQVCAGGTCAASDELRDGGLVSSVPDAAPTVSAGRSCLYTSECPDPLVCRNKICASECLAAADCSAGFDCVNNQCVSGSGTLIGALGGTVAGSGGKVTLRVPPGSLKAPVSIVILPLEAWPDGALGPVFQIVPSGIKFAVSATLTYAFAVDEIGDTLTADLRLAQAEGAAWIALPTTLDASERTLSAPLSHLSIYGVVNRTTAADASPGPAMNDASVDVSSRLTEGGRSDCDAACADASSSCACRTDAGAETSVP